MVEKQSDYARFIHLIAGSKDLHENDRLKILEYAADTCFLNDWNMLYLECKSIIKDLKDDGFNTKA